MLFCRKDLCSTKNYQEGGTGNSNGGCHLLIIHEWPGSCAVSHDKTSPVAEREAHPAAVSPWHIV